MINFRPALVISLVVLLSVSGCAERYGIDLDRNLPIGEGIAYQGTVSAPWNVTGACLLSALEKQEPGYEFGAPINYIELSARKQFRLRLGLGYSTPVQTLDIRGTETDGLARLEILVIEGALQRRKALIDQALQQCDGELLSEAPK